MEKKISNKENFDLKLKKKRADSMHIGNIKDLEAPNLLNRNNTNYENSGILSSYNNTNNLQYPSSKGYLSLINNKSYTDRTIHKKCEIENIKTTYTS